MNFSLKTLILIFILLFANCQNKDLTNEKSISFQVFNPISKKTKYESLEKLGLKRVEVDVPMLEYKKKDTLVQIQYDYKYDNKQTKITSPIQQNWVIPLESTDSTYLNQFFQKYKSIISTSIDYNELLNQEFCVRQFVSNRLFLCRIIQDKNKFYLDIVYYFPKEEK